MSQNKNILTDYGNLLSVMMGIADETRLKLNNCSFQFNESPIMAMPSAHNSNVSPAKGLTVYGDYDSCSEVSRLTNEAKLSEKRKNLLAKLLKTYDFDKKTVDAIEVLVQGGEA